MDEHTEAAEERSSSKREISLTRQGLGPETERTKQKDFPSLWKLIRAIKPEMEFSEIIFIIKIKEERASHPRPD